MWTFSQPATDTSLPLPPSFMHSFIQQKRTEHPLCARPWAGLGYAWRTKLTGSPPLWSLEPRYHLLPSTNSNSGLKRNLGLPWWCSGWESACQCRGHRFEPWSGKIPHAAEQLGPCATTTEPARLEPVPRNKRGRDSERPAHRDEEWPPLAATGESPRAETKTQLSHK